MNSVISDLAIMPQCLPNCLIAINTDSLSVSSFARYAIVLLKYSCVLPQPLAGSTWVLALKCFLATSWSKSLQQILFQHLATQSLSRYFTFHSTKWKCIAPLAWNSILHMPNCIFSKCFWRNCIKKLFKRFFHCSPETSCQLLSVPGALSVINKILSSGIFDLFNFDRICNILLLLALEKQEIFPLLLTSDLSIWVVRSQLLLSRLILTKEPPS